MIIFNVASLIWKQNDKKELWAFHDLFFIFCDVLNHNIVGSTEKKTLSSKIAKSFLNKVCVQDNKFVFRTENDLYLFPSHFALYIFYLRCELNDFYLAAILNVTKVNVCFKNINIKILYST